MPTCKHLMFENVDKDSTIEFCIDQEDGCIDIVIEPRYTEDLLQLRLSEDESIRLVKEIAKLAKP